MPKYEYNGEDERVFPALGITAKKGDSFDGPEGLTAPGLSIVSSAKTAPAATKKETKTESKQEESAPSDESAGA